MMVDAANAKAAAEHAGKKYLFCCAGCAAKFQEHPDEYLIPKSTGLIKLEAPLPALADRPHPAKVETTAYVCPMCPEVRTLKPGPCPTCGMALERERPVPATKVEYTCPMHPQIVRPGPGGCPICGMALEPRTVTIAEEENPELRDMTHRLWISVVLTVPLLA